MRPRQQAAQWNGAACGNAAVAATARAALPPACDQRSPRPAACPAGEAAVPLDELGPLIVNPDGSLRRIANWQELSEGERAAALRRLSRRNAQRLATLQQQEQQQPGQRPDEL